MTTPARVQERKLNIEGYADQLSVKAGDQIGFHISTSAEKYSIEIARVGPNGSCLDKRGSAGCSASGSRECIHAWM